MAMKRRAVAYYRTSSATNVGADKDSLTRQQQAVRAYAAASRVTIEAEFYDAAVSGADRIDAREGFADLLNQIDKAGIDLVLVENASRFARDLIVQLTGHDYLKARGIELVPVDAPGFFTEDTPTAVMVRQILGAVSEFEKSSLVGKLKAARDRKRLATGRCEGRKPPSPDLVARLRELRRRSPRTHKRASWASCAQQLADEGYLSGITGRAYSAEALRKMHSR